MTDGIPNLQGVHPEGRPDVTPWILAAVAALVAAMIVSFPGLAYCPNDASRWNTVYYLVEHGTYAFLPEHGAAFSEPRMIDVAGMAPESREQLVEIGGHYYRSPAEMPLFFTIDMVLRRGDDGMLVASGDGETVRGWFMSSKPPLLPTCLAGIVLTIEKLTGVDFREDPWFIIRATIILVQVIPLLIAVYLIALQIRRLTSSAFARNFCIIAAGFGTYLTPWAVTLNNHVIAACCVTFAMHALLRIWYDHRREWYWFALAGFFASLAATNELPAASFAAAVVAALVYKDYRKGLTIALVAAALPVAAFLGTTKIATGAFTPAYAGFGITGGPYDYPGSYWRDPQGIDALEEPWWFYEANILVGHHGFFSLTPVFLISTIGLVGNLRHRPGRRMELAGLTLLLTSLIACFYTFYTSESKNYGGTTQGARWMFWLIPLWLLFLPEGAERLKNSRSGRTLGYILLGVSVFSAAFALRQPWSAPWLHLLFRQFGWVEY